MLQALVEARHLEGLGLEAEGLVLPGGGVDEVGEGEEVGEGGEDVGARAVGHRVEPHLDQLLLQMRVPEVLYLVVCSPGEMRGYCGPPSFLQPPKLVNVTLALSTTKMKLRTCCQEWRGG